MEVWPQRMLDGHVQVSATILTALLTNWPLMCAWNLKNTITSGSIKKPTNIHSTTTLTAAVRPCEHKCVAIDLLHVDSSDSGHAPGIQPRGLKTDWHVCCTHLCNSTRTVQVIRPVACQQYMQRSTNSGTQGCDANSSVSNWFKKSLGPSQCW